MLHTTNTLRLKESLDKISEKKTGSIILSKITKYLEKKIGAELLIPFQTQLPFPTDDPLKFIDVLNTLNLLNEAGVIENIKKNPRQFPDEPIVHSFRAIAPKEAKTSGHGVDFFDDVQALWQSIGECTERYLWRNHAFYVTDQKRAPYSELNGKALDIYTLSGFSQKQKNDNHLLQFDDKTLFLWTKATSLISHKKLLVPSPAS